MYVPLPVLAVAVILLLIVAFLAVRRRAPARDLIAPPRSPLNVGQALAQAAGSAAATELSPEILAEVRTLVRQGHKLEAIKRVREITHLGLTEAKDLVERL